MKMTTKDIRLDRDTIIDAKRDYLVERQGRTPLQAVIALATLQRRPRQTLNTIPTNDERIKLIGQIRRSDTYDPVSSALSYVRAGADAVAFFTDHTLYEEDLDDLLMVASGIRNTPLIYQNYVLDEYHAVEARASDASALVLYASVLDTAVLRQTVSVTQRWKMTAIVQVSNENNLQRANDLSPHAIGIGYSEAENSEADIQLLEQLRPMMPFNVRVMLMSCLKTLEEVEAAINMGVDAVIVDNTLLGNRKKSEALGKLLERSQD